MVAGSAPPGIYLRKLRTKEKNLGGVIDPDEQECEGAGRPEGGSGSRPGHILFKPQFADAEKHGSDSTPDPDIPPFDAGRRKILEHGCEQNGDHREGKNLAQD